MNKGRDFLKMGMFLYAKKAEEIGRDASERKLNKAFLQHNKNWEFLLLMSWQRVADRSLLKMSEK